MSASLESAGPTLKLINGRRSRRSWSAEEKRRIVLEAAVPGASVSEIARRHGVNANLVFNWRKMALAASSAITGGSSSAAPPPDDSSRAVAGEACEFIPLGVLGEAEPVEPALITDASSGMVGGASSPRSALPRPGMDERPGVIEIDLADGTRLRVDAFVSERALRRVVAALKAAS